MNSKIMAITAVIVVVVVVAAGAIVVLNDDDSDSSDAAIASQLQLYGNANDDSTIDSQDAEIIENIINQEEGYTLEKYPLADANNDGAVDQEDLDLVNKMINRETGTVVNVISLDTSGNTTVVSVTYPLRNIVTYATNVQMPVLYAGGAQYVAGFFSSTYDVAEKALIDNAKNFGASGRTIDDAAWNSFTSYASTLDGGVGALIADYSGIKQITSARVSDLDAADIPLLIFSSADTTDEITTVLTLGYLFGTDCEQTAVKYAQTSWNVISQVNDAIAGISDDDRQTYIALTMFIYICQNDSTFNTTAATAGGIPYYKVNSTFASAYEGTGSLKMGSTEALSNYSDVDILLNCRSMDWGLSDSSEVNALIIDTWDHYSKSTSYLAYFAGFEDKLVYINNLLPGAVKVAYMAHFMYGDKLSLDWADGVLQDFIDMGLDPLEGQTTSSILSYVTQDTYNAAKAATFS